MSVSANSSGVVTGKFTIPAGLPAGAKRVSLAGAGGSKGDAVFVGSGMVTPYTTTPRGSGACGECCVQPVFYSS